jgi:serine/threonine protein kinase/Flp pilus assembly protein TadD
MSQSAFNPASVRGQLRVLLGRSIFRDSERHSRLLEFLVESTLADRASELKEFVIAAEVWGRDVSFDPRIHASVRVEVSRLRTRLRRYYAAEGAQDPVRFCIPTGGYAVVFESSVAASTPPIGATSRFEILESLGRGGMGELYKARDTRLDRLVALKFIPEDPILDYAAVERFELEARAAAAINHPNVCTIYDTGILDGRPFLAMELLEGLTLQRRLQSGPIPIDPFLDWAIQLADGLDAAHKLGIVHRDLKPANLFLTTRDQAKILDFGLAILRDGGHETPSGDSSSDQGGTYAVAGTLGYMSPEQNRGEPIDTRSDLFSLGAVLYEMATGHPAFRESTAGETHRATLDLQPRPPSELAPGIPPELDRILLKAIEKDRELRYQNAADLRADLKRLKRDSGSQRSGAASYDSSVRPSLTQTSAHRLTRRWPIVLSCLALLAVLFAGWYLYRSRQPKLTGDNKIVLAEFANTTGDPVFDAALREGLAAQLEQSPFLGIVSDTRISQTLQLMSQPKGTKLTVDLARQVCQRVAASATIEGSISRLGSQYVIGLRAVACKNGDLLTQVQETADTKEQVLRTLGRGASHLRRKLGESLPSVEKYDVAPESVTTGSLDALNAYSLGVASQSAGDGVTATAHFRRAVALDPNFAMAYARLGVVLNGNTESGELMRKAYTLRDRVSERERYYLVSHYQEFALGNLDAARATIEQWAATYPHDTDAPINLWRLYIGVGLNEQAYSVMQEILRSNPSTPAVNSIRLSTNLIALNKFKEARAILNDVVQHHIDQPTHHAYLYELDFLDGDAHAMAQEAAYLHDKPDWDDTASELESFSYAWRGQFAKARDLSERVVVSARRANHPDDAAGTLAEVALEEAVAGNEKAARDDGIAVLNLSTGAEAVGLSSVALALAGDHADASRAVDGLNKNFPEDTLAQMAVATVHALALLKDGRTPESARRAVAALAPIAP